MDRGTRECLGAARGARVKGSIWISFNLNLAGFDQEDRIDVDSIFVQIGRFFVRFDQKFNSKQSVEMEQYLGIL